MSDVIHNAESLRKKSTIHQVTTMLATSKNILFLGNNHLLITGTDDPTLWLSPERQPQLSDFLHIYACVPISTISAFIFISK